jgi:hypothetical protein
MTPQKHTQKNNPKTRALTINFPAKAFFIWFRILIAILLLIVMFTACRKSTAQQGRQNSSSEIYNCDAASNWNQQRAEDPSFVQQPGKGTMAVMSTASTAIIPVVFHVVYNTSAQNISDAQLQSQIDVLNEDFNAANADISAIPAAFSSLKGNAQIQFVLAKQDPYGNATNGITRTYTSVLSFSGTGVCYSSSGGHDAWPSSHYLNIWVCNKTGAAGSSSYPWSGSPATDGIIVSCNFVGRTGTFVNNWNYQKGRTITHEAGHWLGLGHIWGDALCGNDLVNDTPTQEQANGGAPVFPHVSACNNGPDGDMFMNYMDYTYDATRVMFSAGQVSRMLSYLNGTRASILSSLGAITPVTTTTATITCPIPSGSTVSSITYNSAIFGWTSTGAAAYTVRYKAVGSSVWMISSTSSNSFAAIGLSASTSYEFQVSGSCSGILPAFSASKTFTTAAAPLQCNTPGGLGATSITSTGATLSWYSTGVTSYTLRYRLSGSLTWTSLIVYSNSKTISGLSSSKTYEFQVAASCSSTSTSAFSASSWFSTKAAHGNKKV